MFCQKCGRTLPEAVKFCPKCGNPVQMVQQYNMNYTQAPVQNTRQYNVDQTQTPAQSTRQYNVDQTQAPAQSTQQYNTNYTQAPAQNTQQYNANYTQTPSQNTRQYNANYTQAPAPGSTVRGKKSKKGLFISLASLGVLAVIVVLIVIVSSSDSSSGSSNTYTRPIDDPSFIPGYTPLIVTETFTDDYSGEYRTDDERYNQIAFTVDVIEETNDYYTAKIHVFSLGEYIINPDDADQELRMPKKGTMNGTEIKVIYTEVSNGVVYRDMPYFINYNAGNFRGTAYYGMGGYAKYEKVD